MQLNKVNNTIKTFANLFLDNWVVTVGLSGKDSICVAHCAVEGLKLAKQENQSVGPLYIVTTNTTIDNFELHNFILDVHDAAKKFGRENNLPIITQEITPALSNLPVVEYLGRGKLLRTPMTSNNGRDCTIDWKIEPMKRFLNEIRNQHQTNKVVSASGTRSEESVIRAANIEKRGEMTDKVAKTDMGYTIAPIKDWTLTDVWSFANAVEMDDIDSFIENHAKGLRKHYAAGNSGTCDLFAGKNKQTDKACGARFGCMLCAMVENDKSLQAQIDTSPQTYGYMAPMVKLREFMVNTLYDYTYSRSMLGRELKAGGFVKVGYNQYSLAYRQDLLRYVLTIDAREEEAFYERYGYEAHRFQLIGYKELLMIQYHWAREGGEEVAGEALRIWHEVHTEGKRFDIPDTDYAEPEKLSEYRYFNISGFIKLHECTGLHEDNRHGVIEGGLHRIAKLGIEVDLVPFEEATSATIRSGDGTAMSFVEKWFPQSLAYGHFGVGKCPTTMLKAMLESGVLKLRKGSIPRLQSEAKRAQVYNSLSHTYGKCFEHVAAGASISEEEYAATLLLAKHNSAESQSQELLPF